MADVALVELAQGMIELRREQANGALKRPHDMEQMKLLMRHMKGDGRYTY